MPGSSALMSPSVNQTNRNFMNDTRTSMQSSVLKGTESRFAPTVHSSYGTQKPSGSTNISIDMKSLT